MTGRQQKEGKMKREDLFDISKENIQWLQENYEHLRKEYDKKWIIVHNKKVVESQETFKDILQVARRYDPNSILVEFLQTQEVAAFF